MKRIEAILIPIVGLENVRAQVAADVDFAHSEQMEEIYKPNQDPANSTVRSQQTSESTTWDRARRRARRAFQSAAEPATAPITTRQLPRPRPTRAPAGANARRPPLKRANRSGAAHQYAQGCHHQLRGGQNHSARAQTGGRSQAPVGSGGGQLPQGTDEKGLVEHSAAKRRGKGPDHRPGERGHGIQQGAWRYVERGKQPVSRIWSGKHAGAAAVETAGNRRACQPDRKTVLIGALILYLVLGVLRPC